MVLTPRQHAQVVMQLDEHQHDLYSTNITVGERLLRGFAVYPHVYRSDQMITRYLSDFLIEHKHLCRRRRVLDMGAGTGHIGVVAAVLGAEKVVMTDICDSAIQNARDNVGRFNLDNVCDVIKSDLFHSVSGTFDVIVFNHPFFPDDPWPSVRVSRAMLDPGPLLIRFLNDAAQFLTPTGCIVMPYLWLAGPTNHPAIKGRQLGYRVRRRVKLNATIGLQTGRGGIYQLIPRGQSDE